MRTCSQPSRRKKGQRMSLRSGAAMSHASEVRGANFLAANPTAKWPMNMSRLPEKLTGSRHGKKAFEKKLETAKQSVQFVGRVEIGFEFAGAQLFADFVEAAGEHIERGRKHFFVGQDDVAPRRVGATCEPQRIAEAGAGERNRQAVFIEAIV